jgi:hypothetical protein
MTLYPCSVSVYEDVSVTCRQIRRSSIGPLAVLGLLALSGCATPISSRPVVMPDGHLGYDVRCNGTHNDISDCMNEAARVCSGQYHVATQISEEAGGVAPPASAGKGAGAVIVQGSQRSMIVECGPPPPSRIPVRWLNPST